MTQFNWEFPQFETIHDKVVTAVHWRLNATKNEITNTIYGLISLPEPNPDNFTPFEKLTFEEVAQWIENIFNQTETLEEMKATLNAMFVEPEIITLTPPF